MSEDKTHKLEYRIRFDGEGRVLGESSGARLAQVLGFTNSAQSVPTIFAFADRTAQLDPNLPGRLRPLIARLLEHHEEFALNGDFYRGEEKRHLRISGQAIQNIDADDTFTLLFLDDSTQTELRRVYEYMFRLANHEIKGPLSVITGAVEHAQEQLATGSREELNACLAMIERNALAIDEMVMRYLNLSQIESGAIHLRWESLVFSNDVLAAIRAELQLALAKKDMTLVFEPDNHNDEPAISAPREQLLIVVSNLLSNAVKYGDAGTTIRVGMVCDENRAMIYVENEGPNIPRQYLSQLFQRFMRLEATQGTKGSGLGLYNARKLVELWGGTISVRSEQHATRFDFTIPKH